MKKTYIAPLVEIVDIENTLPIATSLTYDETNGKAVVGISDVEGEEEQDQLLSAGYTHLWDD